MNDDTLVTISTDPMHLDLDFVHQALNTTYWAAGRSRETVERTLRHSLCFSAFLGNQQVGFARVVTDRAVFAYLMDVFVRPEKRRRGVGKALMHAVLTHPDLQSLTLFLLRTRDAHGLYAQFGFRPVQQASELMARSAMPI